MKNIFIIFFLLASGFIYAEKYTVKLKWDSFEGECNGFLNAVIDNDFDYIKGSKRDVKFSGKLASLGEKPDFEAVQTFEIDSDNGMFNFWIKNKFADEDVNNNPNLISSANPTIEIFKAEKLLERIEIKKGKGIVCKVFEFYPSSEEVVIFKKFYPKGKLILGRISDAVNGEELANVKIRVRDQMNQEETYYTNKDGYYFIPAEIGEFHLNFSREGYISMKRDVRINIDEMPREYNLVLSPKTNKFRIVLTWGYSPKDLDAHLIGPRPSGEKFHIWYRHKVLIAGKNFLDKDDISHYGPETITIYKPAKGEYFYAVHDYSHRNRFSSRLLSYSKARVEVYDQNHLLKVFEIPDDKEGNVWNVFKINENKEIIEINSLSNVEDERNIGQ